MCARGVVRNSFRYPDLGTRQAFRNKIVRLLVSPVTALIARNLPDDETERLLLQMVDDVYAAAGCGLARAPSPPSRVRDARATQAGAQTTRREPDGSIARRAGALRRAPRALLLQH